MGGADAPLGPRLDRRRRRGPERLARPRLRPRAGRSRARRPPAREAGEACAASSAPPRTAATPPSRPTWPPCSASWTRPAARPPPWSTTRAAARAGRSSTSIPEEVGRRPAGHGLRRLPRRPTGGAPDAAAAQGAVVFTGASASVKGYARSASFAMGKFALAGSPRAWRASCSRRASTSPTSSSTAASAIRGRDRAAGPARQHARPRRDRRHLSRRAAPAAQRLDLGGGAAALGRTSTKRGCADENCDPNRTNAPSESHAIRPQRRTDQHRRRAGAIHLSPHAKHPPRPRIWKSFHLITSVTAKIARLVSSPRRRLGPTLPG